MQQVTQIQKPVSTANSNTSKQTNLNELTAVLSTSKKGNFPDIYGIPGATPNTLLITAPEEVRPF